MTKVNSSIIPVALSATHGHILSVLAGEILRRRPEGATIKLLDVGCGDCLLLEYLSRVLPLVLPAHTIELYGFDIDSHATQPADFFEKARERLNAANTGHDWSDRLHLIREGDPWPHASETFDVIVSNQVLEHVADGELFFGEVARLLKPGGISVHLFPSHHVIIEPHLKTPLVHWFGNTDLMYSWLRLWARTGRSAFERWSATQSASDSTIDRYALVNTDFLQRFTHYRTQREITRLVKAAGMHSSFSASSGYLTCALSRKFRGHSRTVSPQPPPFRNAALTLVLRYLTSLTLVTTRDEDYTATARRRSA